MGAPPLKRTISRLDLFSLRLFLTICEEKSISRAAERECLAPSAATKRVQELEHLFNVQLLYRNARATIPTPVGEALAEHARNVFQLVEDIRIDLGEFVDGVKGHVRVAATPSALVGFAAQDMRAFMRQYPRVALDIRELTSAEVVHAIETGTVDIGIHAALPDTDLGLISHFYQREELRLLISSDNPLAFRNAVSFAELLEQDYIAVHENSSVTHQLRKAAHARGRQFSPRYSVQSNDVACALVAAGFGVTLVPPSVLGAQDATHVAMVALSEDWAHRELRICARQGFALPAPARELMDFLRASSGRREMPKLKLATRDGMPIKRGAAPG